MCILTFSTSTNKCTQLCTNHKIKSWQASTSRILCEDGTLVKTCRSLITVLNLWFVLYCILLSGFVGWCIHFDMLEVLMVECVSYVVAVICNNCVNIYQPALRSSDAALVVEEGDVRFEVLTALFMNIQVFWDVTACRLVNNYWSFRGTYRLWVKVVEERMILDYNEDGGNSSS